MNALFDTQGSAMQEGISTLIFLVVIMATRFALVRYLVHGREMSVHQRRWWMATIRNALALVFAVGLVFIWAEELRSFAVSLVAIAVAVAIVTKELLLCVIGTMVRTLSRSHSIGDHIEIGDARATYSGYVVDQAMLSTTIDQTTPGPGPREYTGRQIVLPNSLFVTSPLATDFMVGGYTMQTLTVPMAASEDIAEAERRLLAIAREECAPVVAQAAQAQPQRALAETTLEPRVTIELPAPQTVHLVLRIPTPAREHSTVGQAILRRFLTESPRAKATPGPAPA